MIPRGTWSALEGLLLPSLGPFEQAWIDRERIAESINTEWNGDAMLEIEARAFKLLDLEYLPIMMPPNFSCAENQETSTVFLQTSSTAIMSHLLISLIPRTLTKSLIGPFGADGSVVGEADTPLMTGAPPEKVGS